MNRRCKVKHFFRLSGKFQKFCLLYDQVHELIFDKDDLDDGLAVDGAGDLLVLLGGLDDEVLLGVDGDVDRALELAEDLDSHLDVGGDGLALDRKSTRLNSSHNNQSRMPSSA